jgi:hypothetical protein
VGVGDPVQRKSFLVDHRLVGARFQVLDDVLFAALKGVRVGGDLEQGVAAQGQPLLERLKQGVGREVVLIWLYR